MRSPQREQFLADIICTAIEGGTNYWATCLAYKWLDRETDQDLPPGQVKATIAETDALDELLDEMRAKGFSPPFKLSQIREIGPEVVQDIDIEVIATGIRKVQSKDFRINGTLLECIRVGDKEDDAGLIDADGADVIVQAALFGEIVFG